MTKRDIISVQLESFFGSKFPQMIQLLVDDELNHGRWVDGYDLAVSRDVIDGDNARKLLEIVLTEYPELRIDQDALMKAVEEKLPQNWGAPVSWIVGESGAYALTDTLRVARFERADLIWRTPRISWDGIEFDSLIDGRLRGRAWMLTSNVTPDTPFELDFETGELLAGEAVPY
ncbi:hypothetical protein [Sulfuriroseicoccus oceanibius]|uniref:Uncharacterized protein n=1 Tax=Sulfuriroseicoccus oceanibius TaxID=2707525 RepID=A0A6B3LDZ3_9BACT|nr:hypothetical protein [Sulfuriroseicoccus oceanibius]QQL44425.1 hypothetical protein G3M56_011085 [Sulfuriroseicoccus oceanibius]